ncbi:MAG: MFS transporter [Candidatus Kariarchaeaceae archaeon]
MNDDEKEIDESKDGSNIPKEKIREEGEENDEISYKAVLRNKNFVKILLGQFFSNFADNVLRTAILMYVYDLTGDLAITTITIAVMIVPWIIVGPIAGVLADRISRKAIMVSADVVRGMLLLLVPLVEDIPTLMIIVFFIGVASASFTAPRSAAIPEITGMKLFVKAISLSQLVFQTMSVIGPLLGAIIYAMIGPLTFLFSSICYFVSAVILFITVIPSAKRKDEALTMKLVFSDLKEGVKYLAGEPMIRKLMLLFTIMVAGGAFAGTLIYPYLFEILHDGVESQKDVAQTQYGIIGAIIAFGSIIGNLVFGKFEKQIGRRFAIFVGSIGGAFFYYSFIFFPGFEILAMWAIVLGLFSGMSSLAVNAIFAETVPNNIRGRAYSAVNAYIQIFSVISMSLSGITAESIGIVYTVVGAGACLIMGTYLFAVFTNYFEFTSAPPHVHPEHITE